ncbi:DUF4202 domain-containing protein [Marinoscillum sp. MHG1-6]|uniref:DUF4202 domain-containing protein n=1 Tax=Marinoscillum sp. MHG1-6 TaxID=2959627 RepID=UPI0021573C27|nr:DUF4202 domain-containing protein [Marinoscillum sp. MHG1-6]
MSERLQNVLAEIDQLNGEDPNVESFEGNSYPKELLYGQRMTEILESSYPESSELLQIATRGQHIKRWVIPRKDYPMDRKGYLKWRTQLKIMHGDLVAEIMQKYGYEKEDIKYVRDLLMKKDLKKNPDSQTLEDIACLVFLKFHIADFAEGKEEDKLIDIIQKTWAKMSQKGQDLALQLPLSEPVLHLIKKALNA